MAESIGTTFVPLPLIYCVNPDEKGRVPGTVVQHDSAAVNFPKASGWRRYVRRMLGRRGAQKSAAIARAAAATSVVMGTASRSGGGSGS